MKCLAVMSWVVMICSFFLFFYFQKPPKSFRQYQEARYKISKKVKYHNKPKTHSEWNEYRRRENKEWNHFLQTLTLFGQRQSFKDIYKAILPTFQCQDLKEIHFGNSKDNIKICVDHWDPDPCVFVKIGSDGDISVEKSIHETFPKCRIFTLDCQLDKNIKYPSYIKHYPWCLSDRDSISKEGIEHKTWSSIVGQLNVPHVNLLMLDLEGKEWEVLPTFIKVHRLQLPHQLLFDLHFLPETMRSEIHTTPDYQPNNGSYWLPTLKLFDVLDDAGYHLIMKESTGISWNDCCQSFLMILPWSS